MALRWIDSFDYVGASKYDAVESGGFYTFDTPGRTGPSHLGVFTNSSVVTNTLPVSGSTAIVGVAFYMPAASLTSLSNGIFLAVQEGGIFHMCVGIDYNPSYGAMFKLKVLRGTTDLTVGSTLYPVNTWFYLEFKTTIHASAGSYELRVDTVPVITGSGDTSEGGTSTWNRVGFYGPMTGSVAIWFDDYYVCDGSGSARNNFLGIQRVEAVLMKTDAAGIGTHQEWTPSSGTDHGAMVDETAPDGDATYNLATAAAKDSYQHNPLTLVGAVQGVQVNPYWRKADAGDCTARTLARVGGTTYAGTIQSPLTTYSVQSQLLETNPAGGDWTTAIFNSAEFGVERVT